MNYVLDTHALIWYFTGSEKLKRQTKEIIDDCISKGGKLLVPTIRFYSADIITKDRIIRSSGEVESLF